MSEFKEQNPGGSADRRKELIERYHLAPDATDEEIEEAEKIDSELEEKTHKGAEEIIRQRQGATKVKPKPILHADILKETPHELSEEEKEVDKVLEKENSEFLEEAHRTEAEFMDDGLDLIQSIIDSHKNGLRVLEENQIRKVVLSLTGIDNDKAWRLRYQLEELGADITQIINSIAGIDSPNAWRIRENNLKHHPLNVMVSLTGLETAEARKMRSIIERENAQSPAMTRDIKWAKLLSFTGSESDEAKALRNETLGSLIAKSVKDYVIFDGLCTSLGGVNSDEASKIREKLFEIAKNNKDHMFQSSFILSLIGANTPLDRQLRQKISQELDDETVLLESLSGLDSAEADEFRLTSFNKLRKSADVADIKIRFVPENQPNRRLILQEHQELFEALCVSIRGVNSQIANMIRSEIVDPMDKVNTYYGGDIQLTVRTGFKAS